MQENYYVEIFLQGIKTLDGRPASIIIEDSYSIQRLYIGEKAQFTTPTLSYYQYRILNDYEKDIGSGILEVKKKLLFYTIEQLNQIGKFELNFRLKGENSDVRIVVYIQLFQEEKKKLICVKNQIAKEVKENLGTSRNSGKIYGLQSKTGRQSSNRTEIQNHGEQNPRQDTRDHRQFSIFEYFMVMILLFYLVYAYYYKVS